MFLSYELILRDCKNDLLFPTSTNISKKEYLGFLTLAAPLFIITSFTLNFCMLFFFKRINEKYEFMNLFALTLRFAIGSLLCYIYNNLLVDFEVSVVRFISKYILSSYSLWFQKEKLFYLNNPIVYYILNFLTIWFILFFMFINFYEI